MHHNGNARWYCSIKNKERARAHYEANREKIVRRINGRYAEDEDHREHKLQQQRDRYDADPFYRIPKLLSQCAQRRAQRLQRRKEIHRGEV